MFWEGQNLKSERFIGKRGSRAGTLLRRLTHAALFLACGRPRAKSGSEKMRGIKKIIRGRELEYHRARGHQRER